MLYLFRIRRLIKIALEEYGSVSADDRKKLEPYYNFPKETRIFKRFKVLRKKRKDRIYNYVKAIAESDKYIKSMDYPTPGFTDVLPPSIAVTQKGVKFMTPTIFINTLVGAAAPLISLIVSVTALAISIFALTHRR